MRKHLTMAIDEEELFSFARLYLAQGFPNPERVGCPPERALRQLAQQPTEADLSITEHLACCSECFRDYQGLLAERKSAQKSALRIRPSFLTLAKAPLYTATLFV